MHHLPIGSKFPEIFNCFVEIPRGTHNKYEFDHELGVMKLDRVLHSSMFYPVDYGYIPETLADDGDPLDVLIVTDSPVIPGCLVEVRALGVLKMSDDKGLDDKILAVATGNPHTKHLKTMDDVGQHTLDEIANFFETYKVLEKKETKIEGWFDLKEAHRLIKEAHANGKKAK
ncbi:MAG: inorganic diphosphatase [Candidatus Peribacteraceae bacterium]|nr:inorganic diphosphatase [Candidatus Peribacteraceae bacterium]